MSHFLTVLFGQQDETKNVSDGKQQTLSLPSNNCKQCIFWLYLFIYLFFLTTDVACIYEHTNLTRGVYSETQINKLACGSYCAWLWLLQIFSLLPASGIAGESEYYKKQRMVWLHCCHLDPFQHPWTHQICVMRATLVNCVISWWVLDYWWCYFFILEPRSTQQQRHHSMIPPIICADKSAVNVSPKTCPYLILTILFVNICINFRSVSFAGTFNSKVEMPPLTVAENNLLNGEKGDEVWVSSLK